MQRQLDEERKQRAAALEKAAAAQQEAQKLRDEAENSQSQVLE